ncbi:flagellar motor protein MotB [Pseudomonadota bacterium]
MSGKAKKGGGGAPAWIVTFADLMSLLLTFFVLLLSFSSMEVQEFKKMAGSMSNAFGLQSFDALSGIIELEGSPSASSHRNVVPIEIPEMDIQEVVGPDVEEVAEGDEEPVMEVPDKEAEASRRTFNDLQTVMADEIAADVMDIIRAGNVTVVRFPDKVSFPSGSGDLKPEFLPVLGKFLTVLEESDGHIIISGHTDDIPISTDQYRSNWDLSAGRATSVAHYILDYTNIDANRITVQGYADSRPLAANDSNENRAKNRRVEITIQQVSHDEGVPIEAPEAPGEPAN